MNGGVSGEVWRVGRKGVELRYERKEGERGEKSCESGKDGKDL